jgi:hypothetical protein
MKKLFLSLVVAFCALIGTLYYNGQNNLSKAKYEANLCGSTDGCISDTLKNNGFDCNAYNQMKIISKWKNTIVYQLEHDGVFCQSETERIKDKKGTLLRSQTSFGFFECYSVKELKEFLLNKMTK